MEYILGEKEKGCTFCRILEEGPDGQDENLVLVFRDDLYVVMNRYPYSNGHVMVLPNRHVQRMGQLSIEENRKLFEEVRRMERLLERTFGCEGINVGINLGEAAGAGIEEHLHVHLVPRWFGDTNFMTAIGEVRVVPEHIRQTYHKLLEGFAGLEDDGQDQQEQDEGEDGGPG
jgi:ATP adenylyltransferase